MNFQRLGKAIIFCLIPVAATWMPSFSLTGAVAGPYPGTVLGVDQLINNVDRYKGLIRVQGVVTAVVPDRRMIAVVDIEQFKKCGILNCPTYLVLPVVWSGAMPSLKDAVTIEGQIKESGGKLVFDAKKIEKQDLQLGGAK